MSKHLLLFTIGPVQSFIAQARKTQDLYAGSSLLSELIKTAIKALKDRKNIIFPYAYPEDEKKWNDLESLPNRFLAVVHQPKEKLQQLGEDIEAAVRQKWMQIATNITLDQGMVSNKLSLQKGFFEQIRQQLDIFWIFESLSSNYATSFSTLERKMGAIKNMRVFEQYTYNGLGERGRKCSLDGIRNVKFYRMTETQQKKGRDYIQKNLLFATDNCVFDYSSDLPLSILQPGEGLSAVSFVKRAFQNKKRKTFESTAEIALMDWLTSCQNEASKQQLEEYKKLYKDSKDDFNAQLYFEDNLNEAYFKNQGITLQKGNTPESLTHAKKALQQLIKCVDLKQCKYYALVAFDGDSMGKWLSKATSLEDHKIFSKLLIQFAQKAKDYIDGHIEDNIQKGRTVYAGGDDFLGFINLNYLFKVLIWLRDTFQEDVSQKVPFWETEAFTFSAGIAIVHYKEPLGLVLSKAKAMEEKAKDWSSKKNAFGLAVIKGSGAEHETIWSFENNSLEHIHFLIQSLQEETFSSTFITNVQREFGRLLDTNHTFSGDYDDLLRIEFKRLIQRSLIDKKRIQKIDILIEKIWASLFVNQTNEKASIQNFFEMLNISNFIHRTVKSRVHENENF